jgi:periplasmic copper chaperone A
MKKLTLLTVCTALVSTTAWAHIHVEQNTAPAGYNHLTNILVPHGCGASPVKEVHIKIPEEIVGVRVAYNRDWKIEIKNRKLAKPTPGEGGRMVTETVDELVYTEPKSVLPPAGFYDTFQFEVTVPREEGLVLWFKSYAVCEKGDDKYVEVPKETINGTMPDFARKMAQFIRSVPGPAPWMVVVKPERPQFPWGTLADLSKAAGPAPAK